MFALARTSSSSGVQLSKSTDFTVEIWTPRLRCTPEQLMQNRQPKLVLAHFTSWLPQSQHILFLSNICSMVGVILFCFFENLQLEKTANQPKFFDVENFTFCTKKVMRVLLKDCFKFHQKRIHVEH